MAQRACEAHDNIRQEKRVNLRRAAALPRLVNSFGAAAARRDIHIYSPLRVRWRVGSRSLLRRLSRSDYLARALFGLVYHLRLEVHRNGCRSRWLFGVLAQLLHVCSSDAKYPLSQYRSRDGMAHCSYQTPRVAYHVQPTRGTAFAAKHGFFSTSRASVRSAKRSRG